MSRELDGASKATVRAAWREIEAKDPIATTAALGDLDQDQLDIAIEMIAWFLDVARTCRTTRDAYSEAGARGQWPVLNGDAS